jgi:uncharacterized protein YuzE
VKISYDPDSDTLSVVFRPDVVAESDEEKAGVILDYNEAGEIVAIEILDASRRVSDPRTVEFTALSA